MNEPKWVTLARTYIGTQEVKGVENNPKILELWKAVKLGGIKNDEVPWCAGFVGGILEMSGYKSTRADSARSYLKWGTLLRGPVIGCIVVFERGAESGHVGFIVGRDARGNLAVLGGNQGDKVCIAFFDPTRVLGYRWPSEEPAPVGSIPALTLLQSNGEPLSTSEA